jgi:uncharacterized protein YbcI
MDDAPPAAPARDRRASKHETDSALVEISRAITSVHARFYGRGPERAHTTWQGDHLVCALDQIYTQAERTLINAGRYDQVREMRQAFQDEVEPLLRQMVESITGRPVRAFFSQISADPEMAVEVFVLETAHERGPHAGPGD